MTAFRDAREDVLRRIGTAAAAEGARRKPDAGPALR
jgi:hypothetical protein